MCLTKPGVAACERQTFIPDWLDWARPCLSSINFVVFPLFLFRGKINHLKSEEVIEALSHSVSRFDVYL